MPPHSVKAYVKRGKNDAVDAAAICEAVTRPTMFFVAVKGIERQSILMVDRGWELLVRQRTMAVSAMGAHMAEFGIVAPVGVPQAKRLLTIIADPRDERLPPVARSCRKALARRFLSLDTEIVAAEKHIHARHQTDKASRRLEAVPGIGRAVGATR